jgi:hypothetical protein
MAIERADLRSGEAESVPAEGPGAECANASVANPTTVFGEEPREWETIISAAASAARGMGMTPPWTIERERRPERRPHLGDGVAIGTGADDCPIFIVD